MNEKSVLLAAGLFGLAAAIALRYRGQQGDEGSEAGGFEWGGGFAPAEAFDYYQAPPQEQEPAPEVGQPLADIGGRVFEWIEEGLMQVGFVSTSKRFQETISRPENAQLVAWLAAAESREGIPPGLLVRLAYQESRFRPDIIDGRTVSRAGAVGIMQIVPKWHPDADPLNPQAAIDYGARYLRQLFRQFGTWELALKAYNTGPGNLRKILAGTMREPAETAAYSRQILADVPAAQPRIYA